jgi:hypothetical protein
MLTRRQLLIGSVLGGMGAGLLARGASAFSVETMPRVAANAFALGCKPLNIGGSDHGQLVAATQAGLKAEIARGVAPADAQQVIICPICGCRIIVTADASY